jgi:hypothetical protein
MRPCAFASAAIKGFIEEVSRIIITSLRFHGYGDVICYSAKMFDTWIFYTKQLNLRSGYVYIYVCICIHTNIHCVYVMECNAMQCNVISCHVMSCI